MPALALAGLLKHTLTRASRCTYLGGREDGISSAWARHGNTALSRFQFLDLRHAERMQPYSST